MIKQVDKHQLMKVLDYMFVIHQLFLEMDFEVYDERSKDWSNATVELYLSIKD